MRHAAALVEDVATTHNKTTNDSATAKIPTKAEAARHNCTPTNYQTNYNCQICSQILNNLYNQPYDMWS